MFKWIKFIKGEIVVKCDTEEKWNDFMKACEERGLSWFNPDGFTSYSESWECIRVEPNTSCMSRSSSEYYISKGYKLKVWEISVKSTPVKTDIAYLILDASGSIDQKKIDEYKKINNKLKETNGIVKIITHTTVAQFNLIDCKMETGGTYMSSGILLASGDIIANRYKKNGKKIKVVSAGDGDNWSEDNERFFNVVENLLDNEVDYEYYEINPTVYATTMHKKLENKFPELKANNKLHIIKSEEEKKPVMIYEVEHSVGGKLYDFMGNGDILLKGQMVKCDTKYGRNYGKIINKCIVEMTHNEKIKYKCCEGLV